MKKFIKECVPLMSVITGIYLLFLAAYLCDRYTCYSKTRDIGMEYRYGIISECQIKHGSQWIPLESYRVIN